MYLQKHIGFNPALTIKRQVLWVRKYIYRYAHATWKFLLTVGEFTWFFLFEARVVRKYELNNRRTWDGEFERIEARYPFHGGY